MTGLMGTVDPTFTEVGDRIPHRGGSHRQVITVPSNEVTRDIARGRYDSVFWVKRFLGIDLHRSQRRWLRACTLRGPDGWSHAFLTTVVAAGNRAGKTLAMACLILHQCFYKLGIKPPAPGDRDDSLRWLRAPYHWYHLGIQQETAELVYNDILWMLQSTHPAQRGRGCPLVKEIGPVVSYDKKFRGEYLWLRFHPDFGGAEVHFRSTQDKAKAMLGKDMNGISFDEAAFEIYLRIIRDEVLNMRRLSTRGQLHFIGTSTEGFNAFADLWDEGDPASPNRDPNVISLRMSTRDNIGYGLTQEAFDDIVAQMPTYLIPQNIDGMFIAAVDAYFNPESTKALFRSDLEVERRPEELHRYAQGVDPAISSDAAWCVTLDYTAGTSLVGVRARRRAGRQTIPQVVNMVLEGHELFRRLEDRTRCTTIVDSTGMGGKMYKQELDVIKPLRQFDFAGAKSKKLKLLATLRTVIDNGRLTLPASGIWLEVRRQLLGYKLKDEHLETDAVMALALAVWHAVNNTGSYSSSREFDFFHATSD